MYAFSGSCKRLCVVDSPDLGGGLNYEYISWYNGLPECVEDSVEAGYGFEEKPRLKEINK